MDRLSTIENELVLMLEKVDKTLQPNGYQYLTDTGRVLIDDEVIADGIARSLNEYSNIDYTIEQFQGETNEEWGLGTNCLRNTIVYEIVARVKNDPTAINPKRTAKIECNKVLQDVKYALSTDTTLNGNAYWIKYNDSERQYNSSQNLVRSADLFIYVEVSYGQALTNPSLPANN